MIAQTGESVVQEEVDPILREELDHLADGTSSHVADKVLHIPHHPQCRFKTLCLVEKYTEITVKHKPLSTYPSGWRPWCKNCVRVWMSEREGRDD